MSTSRHPAGTPSGGQFAPGRNTDADVSLESAWVDHDDFPMSDWRHDVAAGDTRLGYEDWVEHQREMVDEFEIVEHDPVDPEWASVGVTDRAAIDRLVSHGVEPSDFTSSDRDRRMWARSERGDLVFEGQLLSSAIEMSRHGVPDADDRAIVLPSNLRHADLVDQAAYIDGYCSAAAALHDLRGRGVDLRTANLRDRGWQFPGVPQPDGAPLRHRLVGRVDALNAEIFREAHAGRGVEQVLIRTGDSADGVVTLTDVETSPDRRGFVGRVAANSRRFTSSGETVTWNEGSPVRFDLDAVSGCVATPPPD